MRKVLLFLGALVAFVILCHSSALNAAVTSSGSVIWIEAEQFDNTGGWSNDSQFVDLMGSPYLLATGLGTAVDDAFTTVTVPASGMYRLWVRCKDWLPGHCPGRFEVTVAGRKSPVVFGKANSDRWRWVDGGTFELQAGDIEIRLRDLTGWWGRCDAVVLSQNDFQPADDPRKLAKQRADHSGVTAGIKDMGRYDVVVVGGGLAGCGAAVAAARNGCEVAFIQDRPVLGGNSSSEIQVPVMGHCFWWDFNKYDPGITGLIEEFYPEIGQTGRSSEIEAIVRSEKNISLYLNTRATGVEMKTSDTIGSVLALNVNSGQKMRFAAPLFIDCTGHGWVGYYAGAEYRMGQEARSEFNESLAPVKAGKRTMGNNLYNAKYRNYDKPVPFECPEWAWKWTRPEDFEPLDSNNRVESALRPENFDRPSHGKGRQPDPDDINGATYHRWWVEYGGMLDIISDAEKIRDELFRITLGLWNYAKNHNPATREKNKNRKMVWLNYVSGVRESRRLVGDYIMTQMEYEKLPAHNDTVAFTDWGIDLHHPEGFWVRGHDNIHVFGNDRTPIPYRTLYSKNINNLLMAGRCISVTHVALGGIRIMRTVCMTGQAVGTAAAIARQYDTTPRGVYTNHIEQLKQLMLKDGCFIPGVKNCDSGDIALGAKVTASSFADQMEPAKINDGWNRVVGNDRSAWAPDPNARLPQWIELKLEKVSPINTVHVSFEYAKKLDVDFAIEVWSAGRWKKAAKVIGNNARRRVIELEPVETDRLRLIITKASPVTAICEIRLYNEPK